MIFDSFDNINRYFVLNSGFSKAVDFLMRPDLKELPVGEYEIDGDRIYAIISKENGQKKEDGKLEIHRKYTDIQVVLSGIDEMGWKPSESCVNPTTEFDKKSDIRFFSDVPDAWIPVRPGYFVIFFPEDAHMPLISDGQLHKVVVKVSAE